MDSGSWQEVYSNRPITGRNNSFTNVLNLLLAKYNRSIVIVETGCIRNTTEESRFGDGWSTLNWEWFAKLTNSSVYVVDIDENHLEKAKEVVSESEYVTYKQQDSIEFLQNFHRKIDFLFLDSYDYCGDEENVRKCHEHQLNEVKAVMDKLNDRCLILIDDVFNEQWNGKGKLSIPYLLENGFEVLHFIDNQVLLIR
jgi:hypothetical protein